ncbi:RraA family protein [Amycolatopsis japonica]
MSVSATESHHLTSATVHEAGGGIGALPSPIKPLSPAMHIAAAAYPVRVPPGDNLWLHRAVYAASPGQVLVADTGGGFEYGYWGEVLAEAAIARGLAGLVITGGVRDSVRLIELGWPVFAERVCIRGTGKDPDGDGALGDPIVVGGIVIRPGDLIVGDADGVVCVPADRAEEVRAAARHRDEAEVGYIQKLRDGGRTLDIYQLP